MYRQKRYVAALLLLTLAMLFSAGRASEAANWIDSADVSWYSADKEAKSFTLTKPEHLAGLALLVCSGDEDGKKDFAGCTISLGSDIDLSGADWTPVGITTSVYFNGSFDGRGHTVSGLGTVTRFKGDTASWGTGYYGLFGNIGPKSAVRNVIVNGSVIASGDKFAAAGGVVGYATYSSTYPVIENCTFSGTLRGRCGGYNGGIVGYNNGGRISNCAVYANITADKSGAAPDTKTTIGGIAGYCYNSAAVIENCYFGGDIKYADHITSMRVGGIVGDLMSVNSTLQNCAVSADIDVRGGVGGYGNTQWHNCAGGIAGYSAGIINNTAVKGSVVLYASDDKYNAAAGGVAGVGEYASSGPLASNSSISCAVSVHSLSAEKAFAGALVGYNNYNPYTPTTCHRIVNNRWVKGSGVPTVIAGNWDAISGDILGDGAIVSNDAVSSDSELPVSAVLTPVILRLVENKSFTLKAMAYPLSASNKDSVELAWTASDTSVISLIDKAWEAVVKGLRSGFSRVTLTCGGLLGGENSYSPFTYTVVYRVAVEGLTLSTHAVSLDAEGKSASVTAVVLPDVDTPSYTELKWTYEVVSGDGAEADDLSLSYDGDSRTAKIVLQRYVKGAVYKVTAATVDGSSISDSLLVSAVEPTPSPDPRPSSSSGGCSAGFGAILLLASLPVVFVRRKR